MNDKLEALKSLVQVVKEARMIGKKTTTVTEEFGDYQFNKITERLVASLDGIVQKIEISITDEPVRATENEKSSFDYHLKQEKEKNEALNKKVADLTMDLEREKFRADLACGPIDKKKAKDAADEIADLI